MRKVDVFVADALAEAMNMASMTDFYEKDVTFNFESQPVFIPHHKGTNLKRATRTVYRVRIDENKNLIGSVLRKGEWNRYRWIPERAAWYPIRKES